MPWDAAQKAAFIQMQFDAQHAHYREHFGGAAFDVILVDGQPAGALRQSWRRRNEDRGHRAAARLLQPRYRNGAARGLQAEAAAADKPLRIHVERFNPALRLYQRLGFQQIVDRGVYLFMEWRKAN